MCTSLPTVIRRKQRGLSGGKLLPAGAQAESLSHHPVPAEPVGDPPMDHDNICAKMFMHARRARGSCRAAVRSAGSEQSASTRPNFPLYTTGKSSVMGAGPMTRAIYACTAGARGDPPFNVVVGRLTRCHHSRYANYVPMRLRPESLTELLTINHKNSMLGYLKIN